MTFEGCGKRVFCEHNKDNLKCGTEWNGDIHYCERCFGKLEETAKVREKLIDLMNRILWKQITPTKIKLILQDFINNLGKEIYPKKAKNE